MKLIKISIMTIYIPMILTACASPKSEIGNITFNSPNTLNDENRDKIIVHELLEPMKSYCDFYYLAIGYSPEDRIKNNDRFFHYGTCLFDIKEWNNASNLTFRYTAIPKTENIVFCNLVYFSDTEMETCTKIDSYVSDIYHTIPQSSWKIHTIKTQEIIENSIKDKEPIGIKEKNFDIFSSQFKERNDRYVTLEFYADIVGDKIEHRIDIRNYWKYQYKSLWR